jgi:hypothetical protein
MSSRWAKLRILYETEFAFSSLPAACTSHLILTEFMFMMTWVSGDYVKFLSYQILIK